MNDVLVRFEAFMLTEKRAAFNTVAAYVHDLSQFAMFLQQREKTLEQTKPKDIKDFLQVLMNSSIGASSRSRKLSAIKAFFGWASIILQWNHSALDIPFPKLGKKLPVYLTEQEIERLLATAQQDQSLLGKRNCVLFYLLYASGMRISELVQVTGSDLQLDAALLKIKGKGNKERFVPLPESVIILLHDYIVTVRQQLVPQVVTKQSDYLFPVFYKGIIKPISRQLCWLLLKRLCRIANIHRSISPHALRHSLATHLLKKGAHLRSLQMLLGHESIATVQVYTHVEKDHLRIIYDKKHPRA